MEIEERTKLLLRLSELRKELPWIKEYYRKLKPEEQRGFNIDVKQPNAHRVFQLIRSSKYGQMGLVLLEISSITARLREDLQDQK